MTLPRFHVMWVPGFNEQRDANVAKLQAEHPREDGVCIHGDPDRLGLLKNYGSAVACAAEDGEPWSVISSDDADPLDGWQRELEAALWFAPTNTVSLSHIGSYGEKLIARGVPYGVSPAALWGVAIAYRGRILPQLNEFVQFAIDIGWNPKGDDGCVTAFHLIHGTKAAVTARAIFNHNDGGKSTLGHGGAPRFPRATIAQPGPSWGVRPSAVNLHLNTKPPDVVELVNAWKSK